MGIKNTKMGRISLLLNDVLFANQFTWFWAQGLISTALLQNQLTIIWGDELPLLCLVWRGHLASRNAGAAKPLTKRFSLWSMISQHKDERVRL